jgi:uncharacterized membrane protein
MNLFNLFLLFHVAGGTSGLITGTINMFRKKGDRLHRIVGEVFFYSMMATGASSLFLAIMHPNEFLFIIGVFTLYLASTGKRYLSLRQLGSGQKPLLIDWIITIAMLIAGIGMVVFGVFEAIAGNMFCILFFVFGLGSLRIVRTDFKNYTKKSDIQNLWLVTHLQRMVGAYIASVSAFLVVNSNFIAPFLAHSPYLFYLPWLLPSVFLIPLITKWSKKYAARVKN